MSTENQHLDDHSVALLYGKNLFQIDTPEKKGELTPVPETKAAGSTTTASTPLQAGKGVLIILRDRLVNGSTTHQMFVNLVTACQLTLAEIDLISPYTLDLSAADLIKKYAPSKIIMFGVASSEIGLSVYFPDYQVQEVNGVSYLTAPDLALIENDPKLKTTLWMSLKKMFAL